MEIINREQEFMCRRLNVNSMCWEAPNMIPIPVEQADKVLRKGANGLDLLNLLIWRDKQDEQTNFQSV